MTITAQQASKIRYELKLGKRKVSPARIAALAEYDRARAAAAPAATPDASGAGDDRPAGEPSAAGDEAKASSPTSAPAADPGPLPPPPPPPLEPPPHVKDPPRAASSPSSGDWRDAYRKEINFSGDGRQMLCEMVGNSWIEALAGLQAETALVVAAQKTPDVKQMRAVFILAVDDLLPDRARMTPKIGAALVSTGVIVERFVHSKKILAHPKTTKYSPAERERKEQEQRAAHEAEVRATHANEPPPPETAPGPLDPETSNGVSGSHVQAEAARRSILEDPETLF